MSNNDNGHHSGKQMLRPAIVLGPGGTGNQVIRRLKKLVREHYGDTPMLLHFLVLDTDAASFNDQHWAPLPELSHLERMPLYDPQVPFADVRDNAGAYPEIHEWLPAQMDVGLLDRQDGSGQIRMLGRLAFYKSFGYFERRLDYLFTQCQRIQKQLEAMQRYEFDVAADPVVYIVSSICGGQGAGAVVDLAVALRELTGHRFPSLNLIGVLALPSVFADRIPRENRAKTYANAHAAMKEIDYLLHSPDKSRLRFRFPAPFDRVVTPRAPLFDICYLVDNCHARGALSSAEEVYDQIATQLFLEIGTPFGARSESVRVNLNSVTGLELDKVHRTGRRYSGFGNHTITFNREKIVAWAALKSTGLLIRDRLLHAGRTIEETRRAADEFLGRQRLAETQSGELLEALCPEREIAQEQVTAAYAADRTDHIELAQQLWSRLDAFWLRRAGELRARMELRTADCGLRIENGTASTSFHDSQITIQNPQSTIRNPQSDELVDRYMREHGLVATLELAEVLLDQLKNAGARLRAEQRVHQTEAQERRQKAEQSRDELTALGQRLLQLPEEDGEGSWLARLWQALQTFFTGSFWSEHDEEDLARDFDELNLRAGELRHQYLDHFNQAVRCRLAAEARAAAAQMLDEAATRWNQHQEQLRRLEQALTEAGGQLDEELARLDQEMARSRYIGGNTMRRDVTADYVEQYLDLRGSRAADAVCEWLLPEGEFALSAIESRFDRDRLRARFAEQYAADLLRRGDRDSLAEMIERLHTAETNGSLSSRIGEGLEFCLPFWDIRVPGNQFATEVLLVGLEREYPAVRDYLEAHAVAQRGQVYAQIVPTSQDSVILLSRIAHGASYYWHAQDEGYYREYRQAQAFSNFPLHLQAEWRTLPEPIPTPQKYERRIFALGIAYELIAIRGAAYYLDLKQQYSLTGSSRHMTPDWRTIPLLRTAPPPAPAPEPATPSKQDFLADSSRWETMQKFVSDPRLICPVREKLMALFNQCGREAMRQQLLQYCEEVLEPAIAELAEDDLTRLQLETEMAEVQDAAGELKHIAGILNLSSQGRLS